MATRPQLTRLNTTHESTRYEVEFFSMAGYWALDRDFDTLDKAKARKDENLAADIDSRIIVVSESRRIIP